MTDVEIYNKKMKTLRDWFMRGRNGVRLTGQQFYNAKMKLIDKYLKLEDQEQLVREIFDIVDNKLDAPVQNKFEFAKQTLDKK